MSISVSIENVAVNMLARNMLEAEAILSLMPTLNGKDELINAAILLGDFDEWMPQGT